MGDSVNCPNVLANGTCSNTACAYTHNIVACEPCNLIFASTEDYEGHTKSDQHRNRLRGTSFVSHCSICVTNITGGKPQWTKHMNGRKHKAAATAKGISPRVAPQAATTTNNSTFCDLCQAMVQNVHWGLHIQGEKHKSREAFTKYKSAVEVAETDKNGVSVQGVFDFDFVEPSSAHSGVTSIVSITTSLPFCKCVLLDVKLASSQGNRTIIPGFSATVQGGFRNVISRTPLKVAIILKQSHIGRYQDRLEFLFQDTQLRKNFMIARTLKAIVGNKADHEALQPKAPYVPRSRSTRKQILDVVKGVKPPSLNAIKYVVQLPKAEIPSQLQAILSGAESTAKLINNVRNIFMPHTLNSTSYSKYFKNLLWIEEFKMEQDLERYDIPAAILKRHNQYFYLLVPGLAEKRPSVLVGDRIFVQEQGASDGRWFEGHVHVLRQSEVGLCFHGTFSRFSEGRRFHVRFKLNRIPSRRQHQAMDTVFAEDRILFPAANQLPVGAIRTRTPVSMKFHNSLIASNVRQSQAVLSILAMSPGSAPFVVFGPPGTGKTITIVEAIKQILTKDPNARILACAPSNSAADLIASRLREALNSTELFRFYAPSRFKNQVPDELLPYTYTQLDGHFSVPLIFVVKKYRVIVSTCVSASFPFAIGIPRGHFSHIFIDEAGQATEPEAFVSIKTLADSKTNIVLSGDPKQLGPIIRSAVARELGLETSYLERLMNSDAYQLGIGYGKSVVKLVQNFRSHNAILSFPNERFYDNELQQCATASVINKYLNSSYLPSKKFPIVFHAVSGKDDREASSPSFFNVDEVLQIKSYVKQLKQDRRFRTTDSDIGIIAPYHAQCLKLRTALRSVADDIKVGSVEEFQGQERSVIIISTVRSSKEYVEYDLRHTLGFVANPRRFNVAITRAKALLIVVGDPQVLSLDPLWRSFLNYVYLNGGWTGPDITWDHKAPVNESGGYDKDIREAAKVDMNEFARRMESLTLAEVEDDDANVDRPWRDVE